MLATAARARRVPYAPGDGIPAAGASSAAQIRCSGDWNATLRLACPLIFIFCFGVLIPATALATALAAASLNGVNADPVLGVLGGAPYSLPLAFGFFFFFFFFFALPALRLSSSRCLSSSVLGTLWAAVFEGLGRYSDAAVGTLTLAERDVN